MTHPDPAPRGPTVGISSIASAAPGWFVDYQDGNALEVACWGSMSDSSGAMPMVFDQSQQKLVPASSIGTYVLFHSASQDNVVTLLEDATEPGTGPVISLGGMHSRKSSYVFADDGVTFSATLKGSLDNEFWFDIGTLTSPGVESEVLRTVHYVQAVLDSVSGGAVTIRLAWS